MPRGFNLDTILNVHAAVRRSSQYGQATDAHLAEEAFPAASSKCTGGSPGVNGIRAIFADCSIGFITPLLSG